jgi:Fic-DOC domain mobile mystery protein B
MDIFAADDAATPLTDEEIEGLIPTWITVRNDLNAAEQENIIVAEEWAMTRKHPTLLSESFVRKLHKRMFQEVWRWAGKYRTTAKNIGVDAWKITSEIKTLVENAHYWVEYQTYPPDEIGARFHHKLVWIHPFANGNGRHSRLMTDLLMKSMGLPRFSWGSKSLVEASNTRSRYIEALKEADNGKFPSLIEFVRS